MIPVIQLSDELLNLAAIRDARPEFEERLAPAASGGQKLISIAVTFTDGTAKTYVLHDAAMIYGALRLLNSYTDTFCEAIHTSKSNIIQAPQRRGAF